MKALVCELCGGNDIMKQDGYFVCQSCGTKYSVEEARKMMIEGTVNVKIDNSAQIGKWLAGARRAMQTGEWDEAIKYYSKVEEDDPTNMEVFFYIPYAKLMVSFGILDMDQREAAFNVLANRIELLTDINKTDSADDKKTLLQISDTLIELSEYEFLCETNWLGEVTEESRNKTVRGMMIANDNFAYAMVQIANNISDDNIAARVFYYKLALKHYEHLLNEYTDFMGTDTDTDITEQNFVNMHIWIHEIDPSHEVPFEFEYED